MPTTAQMLLARQTLLMLPQRLLPSK